MYGCQTAWAQALDAPVVISAHVAGWCRRPERVTYFRETYELGSALTLHWVGGHFRSQTVAGWRTGNAGAGVLLAGEAVSPNPDRRTVTFMRSFPNRLPLSGAVVRRIAAQLEGMHFDRLYDPFGGVVPSDAKAVLRSSADRYAATACTTTGPGDAHRARGSFPPAAPCSQPVLTRWAS